MEGPSPSSMGNLVPTSHPPSTKLPKQTRTLPGSLQQQLINWENKLQGLSGVGADAGTTPRPLPEAGKLARALHLPQPSGEEKPGFSLHGYILPLPEGPPSCSYLWTGSDEQPEVAEVKFSP